MGFCGAFFGDFNDWIRQDHHFSFEPSGISKTKALCQVINIFQVAENVYLPMQDEQNDFLIFTFGNVKSASELVVRLKKENIERIRGVDVEKVLSTLKEEKKIPFFFTGPVEQWQKEDANLERIFGDKFKSGPVGISVALLTEIRDKRNKRIKDVVTNGSQATTVLLFVHPKKQPESVEAESLDQQTQPLDLSKNTGALDYSKKTGPSNSEPSTSACKDSNPFKLFTKKEYKKKQKKEQPKHEGQEGKREWVVNVNPSLEMCVRGAIRIPLVPTSPDEEFQAGLMMAHLLKKCDEEIERVKIIEGDTKTDKDKNIDALMSVEYEGRTFRRHWKGLKGIIKNYFEANSESIKNSNPERPIFLNSSNKSRVQSADRNLRSIFSNHKKVEHLLRPRGEDPKCRVPCTYCPEGVAFANSELLELHKLDDHRDDAYKLLKCLVCESSHASKDALIVHFSRKHGPSRKTNQKRKTEESSSPGCSKAKRTE